MPRVHIINLLTKNLITSNILASHGELTALKKKKITLEPIEFIKSLSQSIKLLHWLKKQPKSFLYLDSDNTELDEVAELILQKSHRFDFSVVSSSLLRIEQEKVYKNTLKNVLNSDVRRKRIVAKKK
jgi:precorrin-6B methylase 1